MAVSSLGGWCGVLLYLGNDDGHFLEPLLDELAADGFCVNLNQRVYRESGLVFCGMNKVRDYPFGYKHYCVPDGEWVTDTVQYCNPAITFDDKAHEIEIPDLRRYLLSKQSIGQNRCYCGECLIKRRIYCGKRLTYF